MRIRSIFLFETPGSSEASKTMTMKDRLEPFEKWANERISKPESLLSLSNAQTNQVSRAYCRAPQMQIINGACHHDMDLAFNNIRLVKCLARTEFYNEDVSFFEPILAAEGIEFFSRLGEAENVSSGDFSEPLALQLETFRDSMSPALWDHLAEINQQDQALYDFAGELIRQRARGEQLSQSPCGHV